LLSLPRFYSSSAMLADRAPAQFTRGNGRFETVKGGF
jgi:hypothetical protein